MASATAAKITLTFVKERETKRTVRFQEEAEHEDETNIGILYVSKRTLRELDNPEGEKPLTVTVTAGKE